jgi:hypothetical protein
MNLFTEIHDKLKAKGPTPAAERAVKMADDALVEASARRVVVQEAANRAQEIRESNHFAETFRRCLRFH